MKRVTDFQIDMVDAIINPTLKSFIIDIEERTISRMIGLGSIDGDAMIVLWDMKKQEAFLKGKIIHLIPNSYN